MAEDCLICHKHSDNTFEIYRNDCLVINHFVPNPKRDDNYLGYYMIESVRHFKGVYEATESESCAFGKAIRLLSKAMKSALKCEHVYVFVLGDGVAHLHFHVIAKYPGAPREFWGPRVDDWPDAPRGDIQKVKELNRIVYAELNKGMQE